MIGFEEWEPVYEAILEDFGFERGADERARDELVDLVDGQRLFDVATASYAGQTVAIAGGAATLRNEFDIVREADVVVAASIAAKRLRNAGLDVDCVVTDLDKVPETVAECTADGIPVLVHAHGDNRSAIRDWIPRFDSNWLIPTTQAEPVDPVTNFGGFTDGDRAAFFAASLDARRLTFPGWEFSDSTVDTEKRKKLAWAKRLLWWLESRRDERFAVLDGHRSALEADPYRHLFDAD